MTNGIDHSKEQLRKRIIQIMFELPITGHSINTFHELLADKVIELIEHNRSDERTRLIQEIEEYMTTLSGRNLFGAEEAYKYIQNKLNSLKQ